MASYLDCNRLMYKKILILFIVIIASVCANAQRNMYEDIDSSIIENEVEVETEQTTITTRTYEDKVIEEVPTEEEVVFTETESRDTVIRFRNFYFNPDSINAWKHEKKYAWITNLDSLLKQQKIEYEEAQAKNNRKRKKTERKTAEGKDDDQEIDVPSFNIFDNKLNSPILKIILWCLGIAFIGFIIYQLFLSKGIFGTGGKKTSNVVAEEPLADDNMENNFDALYRRAYNAGDMRIAMRYLFLKTLQKLNDKELVQFATDKTNSQYAREIPTTMRNDFAKLALYYEYIWYGNIAVNKETFDNIAVTFNNFLNKI